MNTKALILLMLAIVACAIPGPANAQDLLHRYSFSESGTSIIDSVGGIDGTVMNTSMIGDGELALNNTGVTVGSGTPMQYGAFSPANPLLPAGSTNITAEIWFSSPGTGAPSWAFAFTDTVAGAQAAGHYFIFIPNIGGTSRVTLSGGTGGWGTEVSTPNTAPTNTAGIQYYVAAVISDLGTANGKLSYYLGRSDLGTVSLIGQSVIPTTFSLDTLTTTWLGQSQYATDLGFTGSINEFRVWSGALTEEQVGISFADGPDIVAIPEPGVLALFAIGAIFVVGGVRRRRSV